MSLEKQSYVDMIEVPNNSIVHVRVKTVVLDDGFQISESFHRHTINPGDDYSQETEKVQVICAAVHTPEAIAAYRLAQLDKMPNNTVPARLTGGSQDSQ
jgi:hypothetical protein